MKRLTIAAAIAAAAWAALWGWVVIADERRQTRAPHEYRPGRRDGERPRWRRWIDP